MHHLIFIIFIDFWWIYFNICRRFEPHRIILSWRHRGYYAIFRFFTLNYRMKINLRRKTQKLCSNQFVRPAYLDKNLKCVFLHHEKPFLKIGPFKYEFLNKEPSVGFVHDLISDKQAEKLKDDARPTMKTTPYSTVEAFSSYSRWRTSKVRYFNEWYFLMKQYTKFFQ